MNIGGIQIDNWDNYKSGSNLIIKLIKKNYPKENIIIEEPVGIDFYSVKINSNITITIMPDDSWIDIKKNIDLKLSSLNQYENICRLCKMEIKAKTSCVRCQKTCCIECYIKNFKTNKGIIKCDNCSYKFGVKTPNEYIDILVEDIREKAYGKVSNMKKTSK
jgi:hypothetical protein